jgi:hypothetical protein
VLSPDGSVQLLGQGSGGPRFHAEAVVEVALGADGKLTPGDRVSVVSGLFLYDFFWVPGDRPRLFVLEQDGSISERDPRSPSALLWRLPERIVARPLELRRSSRDMLGSVEESRVRLAPPVVVAQLDDGPEFEVLIVTGPPTPLFAFENLRIPRGGDVRIFEVGPRGLQERVRTPLLGLDLSATWAGEIADQVVWLGAVWTKDSGGFTKPESRVFRFDLASGDPRSWD